MGGNLRVNLLYTLGCKKTFQTPIPRIHKMNLTYRSLSSLIYITYIWPNICLFVHSCANMVPSMPSLTPRNNPPTIHIPIYYPYNSSRIPTELTAYTIFRLFKNVVFRCLRVNWCRVRRCMIFRRELGGCVYLWKLAGDFSVKGWGRRVDSVGEIMEVERM